jgi:hypothetical protein
MSSAILHGTLRRMGTCIEGGEGYTKTALRLAQPEPAFRTAEYPEYPGGLSDYQTQVSKEAPVRLLSRVIRGRPRHNAVAPMIRSGMSGTWPRGMRRSA